jgi:hypothetical protein
LSGELFAICFSCALVRASRKVCIGVLPKQHRPRCGLASLYSVIHIEILLQLANRGRRGLGFDEGLQTDSADAFQRADAERVLPAAIARTFGFELAVHFLQKADEAFDVEQIVMTHLLDRKPVALQLDSIDSLRPTEVE